VQVVCDVDRVTAFSLTSPEGNFIGSSVRTEFGRKNGL
jgi:hypothetical protein